jgi:arylsulfatase A-like enzyme
VHRVPRGPRGAMKTHLSLAPAARAIVYLTRGVFLARAAAARLRPASPPPRDRPAPPPGARRGRNILFITTDQQRYDALGATGGRVARTPVADRLARDGLLYERAHVQNVVCMPSRSTMVTGQHPLTHGVVANGISLPANSPTVVHLLRDAGYHTGLFGKAHFDPHLDPWLRFAENRLAAEGSTGPWRGFDHAELATHGPAIGQHYGAWLWEHHAEAIAGFGAVLTGEGGGDTAAPEVAHNPIAREHYHTDWIADRAIAWLRARPAAAPFFCWVSFPDPHHPFDPPAGEVRRRVDWRDLPLPEGWPGAPEAIRAILARKPRHWLDWYDGRHHNPEGGPTGFRPARLTPDQLREVNAMIHVENELVDEAVGRILAALAALGLDEETDVFYTSDHGELQGDQGLLFKGPYHVDSLMRVPLLWRPAPRAAIPAARIAAPVGLVDLAPTFLAVAGLERPAWMEGRALPESPAAAAGRERVLTTFDSQFAAVGMHLRTIYRDGWVCTAYLPSTRDRGGRFPGYWRLWGRGSVLPRYRGGEGELYDVRNDPRQWENRWDDPSVRRWRDELLDDLRAHLPREREPPLPVAAPT